MSTLDEITKEKQRVSEALARVDAQREKLSSQLGELEATEHVLARYSKVTPANRTASTKTPTAATKVTAAARSRGRLALAAAIATVVFPMPPGPTIVRKRCGVLGRARSAKARVAIRC